MKSANLVFLKILVSIFALVPFRLLYWLSNFIFLVLFHVVRYRRKVVYENLSNSFPHSSSLEIKAISTKYYQHLCDILIEGIKGLSLSKSELQKRFIYKNPEVFPPNESAIILGSHHGNWEWGVLSFPLAVPHQVLGIYKPLNNQPVDNFLNKLRKKWSLHLAPMSKAGRAIATYIEYPTLVVLIADQTPSDVKNAHWLKFLNQDTPFLHGPDKLFQRLGLPVYFFEIQKVKRGFYEVKFTKIADKRERIQEGELTMRYAQILENTIRKNPEYWLWSHKRWKRKRPV